MGSIKITVLSEMVLQEIGKTFWSKKYRDHLRCKGVKPILQYFTLKKNVYYEKAVLREFVWNAYNNYASGHCSKESWQAIRRCGAFFEQVANSGHISTEPLQRWSTDTISLFWQPSQGYRPDKNNIRDLVYLTRQAMLNADLSDKTKSNYTYDGFGDVLRYFMAHDTSHYSEKTLDELAESTHAKFINHEVGYAKYRNILKINVWIKEYYATGSITQKKRIPRSFRYTGENYEILLHEYAEYAASRTTLKPSSITVYTPAKHRKVFEGYTKEESENILASIDRNIAIGSRDYAIILLAYNTGLRGVDIAKLTFDNIDWDKCEIQLVQEKTGVPIALPFNVATGKALMNYILNWRGKVPSKYVFLRMCRPYTKLNAQSLTTVVSKYAIPVLGNNNGKKHGPHSFRRGIGARMLDGGVAPSVMADVFGHSDSKSLQQYTSVSLNGLRLCAGSFDGIEVAREELR